MRHWRRWMCCGAAWAVVTLGLSGCVVWLGGPEEKAAQIRDEIEEKAERDEDGQKDSSWAERDERVQMEGPRPGRETGTAAEPEGAQTERSVPVVLENLGADESLLSETFYRAGDANCRLSCYVRSGADRDELASAVLGINIEMISPHAAAIADHGELWVNGSVEITTVPGQQRYDTALAVYGYRDGATVFEQTYDVTVTLPSESGVDSAVSLQFADAEETVQAEARPLAGDYCLLGETEDLIVRHLCRAELCGYPTEDLRLMRNSIYAAHGRRFQDEKLTEYMEGKAWYRGLTAPEDFSEEVLSAAEKSNIALLKEMEGIPADRRAELYGADYWIENFDFAPYLPLLSVNEETGLEAEMDRAQDCGAYFRVPGRLSLPVTLTRSQWEHVRAGGTEEICVNELTGETMLLECDSRGCWQLYPEGERPADGSDSDIGCRYNWATGLYQLWQASDDTIMKPVYEGDLYLLKGAVWGGMVNLTTASELQEEITPQSGTVYGNCLYHNGRGYFTAVYALGD